MGTFLLGLMLGLIFGWLHAHNHVAAECERIGGFFVGKKTYKCVAVEPKEAP